MVSQTLVQSLYIYRPVVAQNTGAGRSYLRGLCSGVKFSQPSSSTVNDTTGEVQSRTATLFFNVGTSSVSAIDEGFEAALRVGDMVSLVLQANPPDRRYVIKTITEHTFKGRLHHYEAVCV